MGVNGMGEILKEYWAIILAGVAAIGWLFRLESRGLANEREIKRLGEQRKEDRDETNSVLKEIRQDIKKLLSHQSGKGN